MESAKRKLLANLIKETSQKLSSTEAMGKEYNQVEDTGPTPGDAWRQHDAMVSRGLCESAVKHSGSNRYSNLFPFEENRVVLAPGTPDYINASWVNIPEVKDKFILTMAPLYPNDVSLRPTKFGFRTEESTCTEFWRMVEQTDCKLVVMLCKLEPGYSGCSQYFPAEIGDSQTHGHNKVTLESEVEVEAGIVERRLTIAGEAGRARTIDHVQFNNWPNYGVVEDLHQLTSFVKKVYEMNNGRPEPMIVHCSGGIGRSGTFTAVYSVYFLLNQYIKTGNQSLLNGITKDGSINLVQVVLRMREQRHPWMVEGDHQYMLAYKAVLKLLKQSIPE